MMAERTRPPYTTLRDGDQLQFTLAEKVPISEVVANLRRRPIEILVLESTLVVRLTIQNPTGILFELHRHDDAEDDGLVDTRSYDGYNNLRLERTKGTSFRIWLSDDANVEDVQALVNFPIVITRGGFGVLWINSSRAWRIVRNEIDGKLPYSPSYQYNKDLEILNTWSTLPFPEDPSRFALDAFRSKAQFGYEKCGQLIKKYGDSELSRKLRIMQSDFLDKANQAQVRLKELKKSGEPANSLDKTLARYERTLRNIIKMDTNAEGVLGNAAQEAFCSLYGFKTRQIDRADATHLFSPFDDDDTENNTY